MKIFSQRFNSTTATTGPGGVHLTRATAKSVQVLRWPHSAQGLLLQPVAGLEQSGLVRIDSPRPGMVVEYETPTDLEILYTLESRALLVGWEASLILNTAINAGYDHPFRAAQWTPVVSKETLHTGVASEWLWLAPLSGSPRVRCDWNAAPGANCRLSLKPYDDGVGQGFDMTVVVLPAAGTETEQRVMDGTYPSYNSDVVQGVLYYIAITQNSGADRVLSLDMGVEEVNN